MLVHKVEADDDGVRYQRTYNGETDPVLETMFVRFTALSLSDIEEKYEGTIGEMRDDDGKPVLDDKGDPQMMDLDAMDAWQRDIEKNPNKAIVDTLALMWDVPRRCAGMMMVDDCIDDYSTAVGAAFLMANGVEGDAVVRAIKQGVSSSNTLRTQLSKAGLKAIVEAEKEQAEMEAKLAEAEAQENVDPDTQTNPSPSLSGPPDTEHGSNSVVQLTSSGV